MGNGLGEDLSEGQKNQSYLGESVGIVATHQLAGRRFRIHVQAWRGIQNPQFHLRKVNGHP